MSRRATLGRLLAAAAGALAVSAIAPRASAQHCSDIGCPDRCDTYSCGCLTGLEPDCSSCSPGSTCTDTTATCTSTGYPIFQYCDTITCCKLGSDTGLIRPDTSPGSDAKDASSDADATGGGDVGDASDGSDADLPPDPKSNVCYVFIQGSRPGNRGPIFTVAPAATYYGELPATGSEDELDRTQGQFVYSMLHGVAPPSADKLWREPVSAPAAAGSGAGAHWATLNYDPTWPYWWAAIDMLQQLDAVENERLPTSLAVMKSDAGVLRRPHGNNYCRKGDALILVTHSMSGMSVQFLLENMHEDALNYEFLRTGGLTPDVPFTYLDADKKRHWIHDKDEPNADVFNYNRPVDDGKTLRFGKPSFVVPVAGGREALPSTPNPPDGRCFYPPASAIGKDVVDDLFPAETTGTCLGAPESGRASPAAILHDVLYVYTLNSPLRGSPLADCSCANQIPKYASALCKSARSLLDKVPLEVARGFRCNMPTASIQTPEAYLVQNAGSDPGRVVYLEGGTNPLVHSLTIPGFGAVPVVDAVYPKDANPFNDQAVPLSSAMGCNVNPWLQIARVSVSDKAYPPAITSALCGDDTSIAPLKIWPAMTKADLVFAATHVECPHGTLTRAAYVTPASFWTHFENPFTYPLQTYSPGDMLLEGRHLAGLNVPNGDPALDEGVCARIEHSSMADCDLCNKYSNDPRSRWFGCDPRLINKFGITYRIEHRTLAHWLGVEERAVERRQNVW